MLSLQLSQMDKIIADGGNFGEDDPAHYIAFTKAFCEILKLLPQREARCVSNELPRWLRNGVPYPGRGWRGRPMAGEATPVLAAARPPGRDG